MTEENTTDRHDESDSAQFGDDPHHLADTPFEEANCADCGTYVVRAIGYTGHSRCLGCARTHHHMGWGSGDPLGNWYPVVGYTPANTSIPTQNPEKPQHKIGEWAWACIYCREQGTALNEGHAAAMHSTHVTYACPAAPGLNPTDIRIRLGRRQPHSRIYPETTPRMRAETINGKLKAVHY